MKSRKHSHRMKLLIFPKFQVPVIAINLGVLVVMSLIIWIGVQNAFLDMKPAAGLSAAEGDFYRRYLDYQVAHFEHALVLALLAGAAISTVLTLLITHRFSGPLLRLRSHFKAICQGAQPVPPLEFREGDYLSDLPPLINSALERIEAQKKAS